MPKASTSMMATQKYSPEFRREVLNFRLNNSLLSTVKQYNVPMRTVCKWENARGGVDQSESESEEEIYGGQEFSARLKRTKLSVKVKADDEGTSPEDRKDEDKCVGDSSSDYVQRIREVSQEIANEEFCKRKNEYEKLLNEKETAEIHLRTSIECVTVDTSKFQKLEGDIQIWKKKGEVLNEEIRELDEKLQGLKNRKQELNLEKRVFDRIIDGKAEKSRSLKHVIDLRKDEIEKSRQNVTDLKNQMKEVLNTKKSTDPFTAHLNKQIAQKSRELECPVCLSVCRPPILRCPLDHLVCKECRPKLVVCGECRQQYEGEQRHRYAEKSYEDLQGLLKTREEHARNK